MYTVLENSSPAGNLYHFYNVVKSYHYVCQIMRDVRLHFDAITKLPGK